MSIVELAEEQYEDYHTSNVGGADYFIVEYVEAIHDRPGDPPDSGLPAPGADRGSFVRNCRERGLYGAEPDRQAPEG